LITKDNDLKITDFGLAKIFDESSVESQVDSSSLELASNLLISRTGSAAGTPAYMAPEQFQDAKHVDERADIYSFGIMLFQMLEGQLPFVARTWSEISRLHASEPPPRLQPRFQPAEAFVARCLAKRPEQRFATFKATRQSLAQVFQTVTG